MKTESMLADVFASANEKLVADTGEKGTAPVAGSQQETETMADKTAPAAVQPKTETVDDLRAAYPALCTQIAGDAAKAERERIQGIMGLPAAGHGKIVEAAVADGKSTKAEVALSILEAEKATRTKVMDNLKSAETEAAVVTTAPSAQGDQGKPKFAQDADGWRAEWSAAAADSDIRRDFATADHFAQYRQGVADGRIRVLNAKSA